LSTIGQLFVNYLEIDKMDKGTPYQSCLEPFEHEIIALRDKRRPMSCAKIAAYMKDKHQVVITRQAILKFLKVRAKGFKPCQYAESIKRTIVVNQPVAEVSPVSTRPPETPVSPAQKATPKQPTAEKSAKPETSELEFGPFEMKFSETYNLTRLSPEEAAARNKIIEEKMRAKYYPNKQPKEKQ